MRRIQLSAKKSEAGRVDEHPISGDKRRPNVERARGNPQIVRVNTIPDNVATKGESWRVDDY